MLILFDTGHTIVWQMSIDCLTKVKRIVTLWFVLFSSPFPPATLPSAGNSNLQALTLHLKGNHNHPS